MNQVAKITSRKTVKIVEAFSNGFAQQVYKLEDGTILYVSYDQTEMEICTTEPLETPQDVTSFINSLPGEA